MWLIDIDFDSADAPASLVHQVRNFGEDLRRYAKTEKWASIDLRDVDRATHRLTLKVISSRRVRTVEAVIARMLGEHYLTQFARISARDVGLGGA